MRLGLGKKKGDGSGIGTPSNVQKVVSVTSNLDWDVSNPEDFFTLHEQLGKGAYGAVYKAQFKATGVVIAAKKVYDDENAQATIKKEVDILRTCNHPNVVCYYGCVKTNKKKEEGVKKGPGLKIIQEPKPPIWILMDYCGGGSIRDYMDKSKKLLTEVQLSCILPQVLNGLSYLHDKGIIHRDLKAANILLSEDGIVKVADFGISTQLSATITGNAKTMVGTTYWMVCDNEFIEYFFLLIIGT